MIEVRIFNFKIVLYNQIKQAMAFREKLTTDIKTFFK